MDEKRVSPGSIAAWSQRRIQTARRFGQPGEMPVPCGSCNACCRVPDLLAELRPGEERDFPEAVRDPDTGDMVLPKRENGECVHLVDGRCSIYHRRPASCRNYDCRVYLVGLPPLNYGCKDHAVQTMKRWGPWRIETAEDIDAMFAWHRAVAETCSEGARKTTMMVLAQVLTAFQVFIGKAHEVRDRVGMAKARLLASNQDKMIRSRLAQAYAESKLAEGTEDR
jgi:Fe-S-cluster containining protein